MKYLPFILATLFLPTLAFAEATTTGTGFVALTNVPFVEDFANSADLTQFLNGLYRICIGIAAVIAVLQIMRAGIMYMGGDSVTEKKEARNLIGLAIGGLILVLSPVVVFSVINPEILTLKIGNIDKLKGATTTPIGPDLESGTEQTVCSVTYLEKRKALECSTLGAPGEWEMAPTACCRVVAGEGFCCGRKEQAPTAPDTTAGFRYIVLVRDTDSLNTDLVDKGRQCVRRETEILDTPVDCVGALETKKVFLGNKTYQVSKECSQSAEVIPQDYRDLPTCS